MVSQLVVVLVVLSLVVQGAAAFLALRLIPVTGKKLAWSCISAALVLMAVRRLYSLRSAVIRGLDLSISFELLGFVLSFLMLVGLWGIRAIIMSQIDAEHHARELAHQRETLLREVHHRIKNNMNTVRILLGIRGSNLPDGEAATALHAAESQVESMMVLYDRLYRSPNVTHVDARDYLSALVEEICDTMEGACTAALSVECDAVELHAGESFFLGILVNEVVANAAKYAFPRVEKPELRLHLEAAGKEEIRLTIRDNGPGFLDGFDWRRSTGFGMTLIQAMADQLKGSISVDGTDGVTWSIVYPRQ